MGFIAFGLVAMRAQQLQIAGGVGTASRKRDDVVNVVGEKNPMTIRIQPKIGTGVALGRTQSLDFVCSERSACVLLPRAAAFNSGPALVGIPMAPVTRLSIDYSPIFRSHFAFIGAVADFAESSLAVMFRGAIEKVREGLGFLTLPASFLPCGLESGFCLPISHGVGVSDFLATDLTMRGVPVFVTGMLMKLRQWLGDIAPATQFHLASVHKSVSVAGAGGVRKALLFGSST